MKSITAYFTSVYKAQKTLSELRELGASSTKMDIVDRFSRDENHNRGSVISGDRSSLSYLVLDADEGEISMDKRPLFAADPNVSGMGTFNEVTDANIIVTAMINESDENEVRNIIKQNEGSL